MLRRLLTVNNEDEKQLINNITKCIKMMSQEFDIDAQKVNQVQQAVLQEYGKGKIEPTHVPEETFLRIASFVYKIPNLAQTSLYDQFQSALIDPKMLIKGEKLAGELQMISVRQLKLLTELYQFLPVKQNQKKDFTLREDITRNVNKSQFNTITATPLKALCERANDIRSGRRPVT